MDPSVAACEAPLCAEHGRNDALVLGGVNAGWARTLGLAERDGLSIKRRFDSRVLHFNRKSEPSHRVPVRVLADHPVRKTGIAGRTPSNADVLVRGAVGTAEPAVVDHGVVVADFRPSPVERGREVWQPEMLPAGTKRE